VADIRLGQELLKSLAGIAMGSARWEVYVAVLPFQESFHERLCLVARRRTC
jgi:hypothetical protein